MQWIFQLRTLLEQPNGMFLDSRYLPTWLHNCRCRLLPSSILRGIGWTWNLRYCCRTRKCWRANRWWSRTTSRSSGMHNGIEVVWRWSHKRWTHRTRLWIWTLSWRKKRRASFGLCLYHGVEVVRGWSHQCWTNRSLLWVWTVPRRSSFPTRIIEVHQGSSSVPGWNYYRPNRSQLLFWDMPLREASNKKYADLMDLLYGLRGWIRRTGCGRLNVMVLLDTQWDIIKFKKSKLVIINAPLPA